MGKSVNEVMQHCGRRPEANSVILFSDVEYVKKLDLFIFHFVSGTVLYRKKQLCWTLVEYRYKCKLLGCF